MAASPRLIAICRKVLHVICLKSWVAQGCFCDTHMQGAALGSAVGRALAMDGLLSVRSGVARALRQPAPRDVDGGVRSLSATDVGAVSAPAWVLIALITWMIAPITRPEDSSEAR